MHGSLLFFILFSVSKDNIVHIFIGSQETKVCPMQVSTSFDIITVESEMQEPVDENHAIVQDLLSAGYSLEQSIEAVERCETLEAAMAYLDQQILDEDTERDVIPSRPTLIQQTSNDDRPDLDEFRMTWYAKRVF